MQGPTSVWGSVMQGPWFVKDSQCSCSVLYVAGFCGGQCMREPPCMQSILYVWKLACARVWQAQDLVCL